jgi:hypothetical protein
MYNHHHHHHKRQGLGLLARSVSRLIAGLAIVSSVYQLFSFLVGCIGMILKGFWFVSFFAGVEANSVCIRLTWLVYIQSVVRGVWSRLLCGTMYNDLTIQYVVYTIRHPAS